MNRMLSGFMAQPRLASDECLRSEPALRSRP